MVKKIRTSKIDKERWKAKSFKEEINHYRVRFRKSLSSSTLREGEK